MVIFKILSVCMFIFFTSNVYSANKLIKDISMDTLPYIFDQIDSSPKKPINISKGTISVFQALEIICGQKAVFRKTGSVLNVGTYEIVDFTVGAYFDGRVPVIAYSVSLNSLSDSVICHEAWHLVLQAHIGIYDSTCAGPLKDHLILKIPNEDLLESFFHDTNTILHHTYIFEQMHFAGFTLKDSFKRFIGAVDYPSYPSEIEHYQISVDAWHLMAGKKDGSPVIAKMLLKIERDYPEAFELGRKLYIISKDFKSGSFSETPKEQEPVVFKKILSVLFDYQKEIKTQWHPNAVKVVVYY